MEATGLRRRCVVRVPALPPNASKRARDWTLEQFPLQQISKRSFVEPLSLLTDARCARPERRRIATLPKQELLVAAAARELHAFTISQQALLTITSCCVCLRCA